MQALMITGYGSPRENLKFRNVPDPMVGALDILIDVHAAAINPIDNIIVRGGLKAMRPLKFPAPIGFDVSGTIVKVGSGVSGFKTGQAVFARVPSERPGTIAERVAVRADAVALKPENVGFEESASLPLVALTTMQSFVRGGLKPGGRILIHAGSGGIGTFAVQYAKALGAHVFTTTSTANIEWVKELGADRVIDYKTEDYREIARDLDMVYDTLGGDYTLDAFDLIKSGGSVVSIKGAIDDETARELGLNALVRFILRLKARKIVSKAKAKNAYYKMLLMRPDGAALAEVARMVEKGNIKPVLDRSFPFEQSIQALEYLENGRAKGKVVIEMK